MRLIATADWHIHEFSEFSSTVNVKWNNSSLRFEQLDTPDAKPMNTRLLNILNGICDIRDYAHTHNVTRVINAGDVFHKRGSISVTAFNAAYKVINSFYRLGIQLYIIAGNHDQVDSSISPETSIHTFRDIAEVIEQPKVISLADPTSSLDIAFVPYSKDKSYIISTVDDFRTSINTKQSILVAHLGMSGGTVGSGMYMMSDEYSMKDIYWDKWKFVVLGHYHQPQLLSHNTLYPGTPVQNTFNDELPSTHEGGGYNGFYILDTEKPPEQNIEFIPIHAPRFITVNSVDQMKSYSDEGYFRIKTSGDDIEDTISQVEDAPNVKVEVEKDYTEPSRSTIGLNDTFDDALKKYVQEHYTGDNPNILKTGLDILHSVMIGGDSDDI